MNGLFLAIGIGLLGGAGAVARFAIHRGVTRADPLDFPLGTFIVNVAGAFVLGLLFGARIGHDTMLLVGLGFLGGFTTYSAFSQETFAYLQDGAWAIGTAYAALTVLGCLLASLLGHSAARWLVGG